MTAQPLRILFLLSSYNQGGAERQAVTLAKWMKEKGHHVSFTAFKEDGPVEEELRSLHIETRSKSFNFFFIDHFKVARFNKETLSFKIKSNALIKEYATYLKGFAADILMPYTFYPNVLASLAFPSSGAKACIWNQRDINVEGMKGYYLEKKAVAQCSFFISNSKQGEQKLQHIYSIPSKKTNVIHNGIKLPSLITPFDCPYFLPNSFKMVMLGNFHPNKDQATLINAMALLRKKDLSGHVQLILAGRFAGEEKKYSELCTSLDLSINKDVIFLDSVKNVYGLLKACDLVLHSSYEEGCPNAVLEAMAAGLPVIASDINGCREALGENYPFLVPAGDARSFSEAIHTLYNQPETGDELGNRNQKRIENEFSVERMGNLYLDLFKSLAN